jgi:hypothetical protein
MSWAGIAWGWIFIGIIATLILSLVGFFFNWMTIGWVNFIIAFLLIWPLAGLMFIPDITVNLLTAAVISGFFQQPQTVKSEAVTFLTVYVRAVEIVILGLLLLFIFLGAVPIKEFPVGFFILTATIPAIMLSSYFWGFGSTWGKKLTYWGLIILVGITFAEFIPKDVYKQTIGFYPFSFFERSETQEKFQEVEGKLNDLIDEAQAKRLEGILKNLDNKKDLSMDDQNYLIGIKNKLNDKSLPTQIKKIGTTLIEKAKETYGKTVEKNSEIAEKSSATMERIKEDCPEFLPDGRIRLVFHGGEDLSKSPMVFPGKYEITPKEKVLRLAMKSNDWEFEGYKNELTIPGGKADISQLVFFNSFEKETFYLKKIGGT